MDANFQNFYKKNFDYKKNPKIQFFFFFVKLTLVTSFQVKTLYL